MSLKNNNCKNKIKSIESVQDIIQQDMNEIMKFLIRIEERMIKIEYYVDHSLNNDLIDKTKFKQIYKNTMDDLLISKKEALEYILNKLCKYRAPDFIIDNTKKDISIHNKEEKEFKDNPDKHYDKYINSLRNNHSKFVYNALLNHFNKSHFI